jgi:hypothetical protein
MNTAIHPTHSNTKARCTIVNLLNLEYWSIFATATLQFKLIVVNDLDTQVLEPLGTLMVLSAGESFK